MPSPAMPANRCGSADPGDDGFIILRLTANPRQADPRGLVHESRHHTFAGFFDIGDNGA